MKRYPWFKATLEVAGAAGVQPGRRDRHHRPGRDRPHWHSRPKADRTRSAGGGVAPGLWLALLWQCDQMTFQQHSNHPYEGEAA